MKISTYWLLFAVSLALIFLIVIFNLSYEKKEIKAGSDPIVIDVKPDVEPTVIVIQDIIINADELFGKYMPEWVELQALKSQAKKQGIYAESNSLEKMRKILKVKGVNSCKVIKKKTPNADREETILTRDLTIDKIK